MKSKCKKVVKAIIALLIPAAIFYLFEWYTHNPWEDIRWDIQVFNILFFELVMVLVYSLIGRLHIALLLETLIFMIYGLVNYFVMSFRSQPIQPWDFLSIGTAASVAGDFKYEMDTQAIGALVGFVVLIAIELIFCRNRLKYTVGKFYKGPLRSWAFRVPVAISVFAMLVGFVSLLHNEEFVQQEIKMYDKLFTPTVMSERDGTAMAFLLGLQYMDVDKPQGYDKESAQALLQQDATQTVTETPNIIVIMDEAFSDLSVLGDFETNMDYMPFLRSLQENGENAITGNLHVSIKGGNTANTEFEFLTGSTMAFLPQGSIPYQQYIKSEQPSLASYLADLGYTTRAAHPYYASGWERETVYPLLGFGKSDFIDSFTNATKIRKYVSDESAFERIIECYERKTQDQPLFYFGVTMQNHSGYSEEFDNFTSDVEVKGSTSKSLNQYLSLVKKTDEALQNLIEYFAQQQEKTVIVFFGDHQPADFVVEPIWQLQGKTGSELTQEEQANRYKVPFLIWANYDISKESQVEISTNYLSSLVCKTAGLPLSSYQSCLEELRKEVPVLSAQTVKTSDGFFGIPDHFSDYMKEQSQSIQEADGSMEVMAEPVSDIESAYSSYQKLQYYLLFDQN
ncbi:MAG TPA: LTA synthase family protein [Lachnospiraceae bacterium]|nr:LTA synthase family protein [Lachnospiraceae bacterium]